MQQQPLTTQFMHNTARHHVRGMTAPAQLIRHIDSQAPSMPQNNKDVEASHIVHTAQFATEESPPMLSAAVKPPFGKQHSAPGPTPYNSSNNTTYEAQSHEKGWASFDDDGQGLLTATQKNWSNSSDSARAETSSISSEAESVDDVWTITDEQRDYYINQFKSMQPELSGVISGAVAKEFFEKSKLPIQELSKIWQLSDVNQDGALSLEEFCTAMHLVVLRRNEVELPNHLPPSLIPYTPLLNSDEPFAADLPPGSTLKRLSPASPQPNIWPAGTFQPVVMPVESPTSSSVSSPGTKPVNFEFKPITADSDSKILHPVPLRMSPDGQPLTGDADQTYPAAYDNEFEAVLSPTKQRSYAEMFDSQPDTQSHVHLTTPLQSRPRPTPKKSQSISGVPMEGPSHTQPLLLPPPMTAATSHEVSSDRPDSLLLEREVQAEPPPPPPRKSGHSRSSSLDNNLILGEAGGVSQLDVPPPAVPPRPSPCQVGPRKSADPVFPAVDSSSVGFADFTKFETIPSQEVLNVVSDGHLPSGSAAAAADNHRRSVSLDYNQLKSGAYGTYQGAQDVTDSSNLQATSQNKRSNTPPGAYVSQQSWEEVVKEETEKSRNLQLLARQSSRDPRELRAMIRRQKEHNTMLSRLNSELNQELQEVMEQRIALEIQLEHLQRSSY